MKKILSFSLYLIFPVITFFAVFLIYASFKDFEPKETVILFKSENPDLLSDTATYSIITWDIGYCALGKEASFIYDGGKDITIPENKVKENILKIKEILSENKQNDFILLQEVDKDSKRSYYFNEFDTISNLFSNRHSVYGKNYDVFFVPSPPQKPEGKINSGLMTVSKYIPAVSLCYSFPENYSWPLSLFSPDKCFLVNRYKLNNEKELLIINIHNSAYDDGILRAGQIKYLKTFLISEYKKGNYIVVAGNWNQTPPGFVPEFKKDIPDNLNIDNIPENIFKKWKWLYDKNIPTARNISESYEKGKTPARVTDFMLMSPNVKGLSVENADNGFKYSYHQYVKATFKLKP